MEIISPLPIVAALLLVLLILAIVLIVLKCKMPPVVADVTQLGQLKANTHEFLVPFHELQFGRLLGKGSQGEVYLAQWRGSTVAVKRVDTDKVDPAAVDEFCQEANIMRQLRHPSLTLFLGVSIKEPELCIVTEYVVRGSLFDILHDEASPYTWQRGLRIMCDVARGMTYLHSAKPAPILHRDLKSLNILVDANWRGKVADFGMTRIQEEGATMTQCGSPLWMAPEMIRNTAYDEKSDVYSFGICLWEVYMRKIPYRSLGLAASNLVVKVVKDHLRPEIPNTMPRPYFKLMERCWHPLPEKRPSFRQILRVLESFCEDPGLLSHVPNSQRQATVTARAGLPPLAHVQHGGAGADDDFDGDEEAPAAAHAAAAGGQRALVGRRVKGGVGLAAGAEPERSDAWLIKDWRADVTTDSITATEREMQDANTRADASAEYSVSHANAPDGFERRPSIMKRQSFSASTGGGLDSSQTGGAGGGGDRRASNGGKRASASALRPSPLLSAAAAPSVTPSGTAVSASPAVGGVGGRIAPIAEDGEEDIYAELVRPVRKVARTRLFPSDLYLAKYRGKDCALRKLYLSARPTDPEATKGAPVPQCGWRRGDDDEEAGTGGEERVMPRRSLLVGSDDAVWTKVERALGTLAALRHPNLVLFMGAYRAEDHAGVVVELMEQGALAGLLRDTSLLFEWDTTLSMLLDTAQAVKYLHSAKPPLAPAELSPTTLMVDANWRVKLYNTVLSSLDAVVYGLSGTKDGALTLQPTAYTAPECMDAPERVTPAANVYAFAVIVNELFSRRPPFDGNFDVRTMRQVVRKDLRPAISGSMPPVLAALVRQGFTADPAKRPPIDSFLTLLQQLQTEGPPKMELTLGPRGNARKYRKAATIFAYRTADPVTVLKDWGRNQGRAGSYVVCGKDDDVYAVDADIFKRTYEPIRGSKRKHEYRKTGYVVARRLEEPFVVRTKGGANEHGHAGDYLVQNEQGEQWAIDAKTFEDTYEEDDGTEAAAIAAATAAAAASLASRPGTVVTAVPSALGVGAVTGTPGGRVGTAQSLSARPTSVSSVQTNPAQTPAGRRATAVTGSAAMVPVAAHARTQSRSGASLALDLAAAEGNTGGPFASITPTARRQTSASGAGVGSVTPQAGTPTASIGVANAPIRGLVPRARPEAPSTPGL